jgi:hypothetical protein
MNLSHMLGKMDFIVLLIFGQNEAIYIFIPHCVLLFIKIALQQP